MNWSFGLSKYDNKPTNHCGSWSDLANFMANHRAWKKGYNYITSSMGGDGRRCKVNAQTRNWLAFDFDGVKIEVPPGKYKSIGVSDEIAKSLVDFFKTFKTIYYQTASSLPNHRKMRFIVQCDRDVHESESKSLGAFIHEITPMPEGFDGSVHQLSQPIYLPLKSQPIMKFDGDILPVDSFLKAIPPEPPKKIIRRSFNKSTPDAYGFFLKNGLIISESSPGGFDIVCPWAGEHSDGDVTGSVFFLPMPSNNYAGGFKCHHSSCCHKNIGDIFQLISRLK